MDNLPAYANEASRRVARPFLVIIAVALTSVAEAQSRPLRSAEAPFVKRELKQGGVTRTYLIHLPPDRKPDERLPLVMALHGAAGNGGIMMTLTGFNEIANKRRFVAVYPDGLLGIWNFWEGREKVAPRVPKPNDVEFLGQLIDSLAAERLVDPQRVYVTGISNGGYMSNRLACELGDKIAAIAPVCGGMPKIVALMVKPTRPMPVLYIHGTEDKVVGFDGVDFLTKKDGSLAAPDMAAWWAEKNGLGKKPSMEELPDKTSDGARVKRHVFPTRSGTAAAPVVFLEIVGGGHTWPGGNFQPEILLGKVCRDISASELIWDFCSQHRLPKK